MATEKTVKKLKWNNSDEVITKYAINDSHGVEIDISSIEGEIGDITDLIPDAATTSNQLADKQFVSDSISTATSTFRGTFTSLETLQATSGDLNDYAFYSHTDSLGNAVYDRYKYTSSTPHWVYEYTLNNSSYTAAQWSAINSGITSSLVTQIGTNETNIGTLSSGKATKVASATSGHLAGLDTNGDLTDSGIVATNVALKDADNTFSGTNTFTTSPVLNTGVFLRGKTTANTVQNLIGLDSNNVVKLGYNKSENIYSYQGISPISSDRSLGDSSNKWKDLYLSGKIDFANGNYIGLDNNNRISLYYNNEKKFFTGLSMNFTSVDLSPATTETINLGSTSYKWNNLYFSGDIYTGDNDGETTPTYYKLQVPTLTKDETIATLSDIPSSVGVMDVSYNSSTHVISQSGGSSNSTVVDLDNFASISLGTAGQSNESISIGGTSANIVTRDTVQTISGEKTVDNLHISFKENNKTNSIKFNGPYTTGEIYQDLYDIYFTTPLKTGGKIYPDANNSYDLGTSAKKWKDLYLSGNLTDGTNSISVAQLMTDANDNQKITAKLNGSNVSFGINDTIELVAGNNITITPNTSTKTISIAAEVTSTNIISCTVSPVMEGVTTLFHGTISDADFAKAIDSTKDCVLNLSFTTEENYTLTMSRTLLTSSNNQGAIAGFVSSIDGAISQIIVEIYKQGDNAPTVNVVIEENPSNVVLKVNNISPSSGNVTLTASDVGALPSSTVIPTVNNATLTIKQNNTTIDTFTANASVDKSIDIVTPKVYRYI